MNNYLDKVFDTPNKKAFIAFLTAGDPDADSTVKFILEMDKAGADLIEIGIPFSDPTAEGVVIQEANIRSLSNGMTTDGVFEIVQRVREQSEIPLAFMTYVNPVHPRYPASTLQEQLLLSIRHRADRADGH